MDLDLLTPPWGLPVATAFRTLGWSVRRAAYRVSRSARGLTASSGLTIERDLPTREMLITDVQAGRTGSRVRERLHDDRRVSRG